MAIRDVLFHAFEGESGEAVQNAATTIAVEHNATLTGLSVVDNAPIPTYVMPYAPVNMAESFIEDARVEAKKTGERVGAGESKSGVRTEWRYAEGNIREVFAVHARYTDLIVLAQGAGKNVPPGPALNLPGDLVLSAGRPILVVPWSWSGETIGKRVVVAWDASKEATRAMHDAMDILEKADAVKVLTVGPEETRHLPGAETAAHLSEHGVRAEADHVIERDLSTGEAIVQAARDFNADMIVSGAWGHSRVLETIMGGVTRYLLQHPPVPLFMSH